MGSFPRVIPTIQSSFDDNGNPVTKRIRPLTYALLSFIKNSLEQKDTIDISDDLSTSEWTINIQIDDDDENEVVPLFINAYENDEVITFDVYFGEFDLNNENSNRIKDLILSVNNKLLLGCIQLIDGRIIRYHASIDFSNVASKDPEYSGDHLIQPQLIKNIFDRMIPASRLFVSELLEVL